MKLLFCQAISSDRGSGPVDRGGNHFDGSLRVALACGKQNCKVAWSAEVGVKEIAEVQGLCRALCETNISKTQFLKLMD